MDLSTLDTTQACAATFELELKHPTTNEPLGMFIECRGRDSADVLSVSRKQVNEYLRKNFTAQRKGRDEEPPTVEDGTEKGVRILVAATVAWFERDDKGKRVDGFTFGGERLTLTPDEAAKLYANPGFAWLRSQLDEAVGDLGNFMKT